MPIGSLNAFKHNTVNRVIGDGLPPDATLVGGNYDHMTNTYWLTVQSVEFDEVPEGAVLPEINPVFEDIRVPLEASGALPDIQDLT